MQASPILNRRRKKCSKAVRFLRNIFTSQAAGNLAAGGSGGGGSCGGGGHCDCQTPAPGKLQIVSSQQPHQQCRFHRPKAWLIEVSVPPCCGGGGGACQQMQAAAAAATTTPQPTPTPTPPPLSQPQPQSHGKLQSCRYTLEQLQLAASSTRARQAVGGLLQLQEQPQPQQQRHLMAMHQSTPAPAVAASSVAAAGRLSPAEQSEPIDLSMTKKVKERQQPQQQQQQLLLLSQSQSQPQPQRQRTSLREIATDRAAGTGARRFATLVKVSSHRVSPAPRTLWLHPETAMPLSPCPSAAAPPSALTASSATSACNTGPRLTILTASSLQPPPQLSKLRAPAVVVPAPRQPLTPSPTRGGGGRADDDNDSAERAAPASPFVGRVAEAVRHFNAIRGGGVPSRVPAGHGRSLAAAAAAAVPAAPASPAPVAAAPTAAATTASTPAPPAASDDPRPPRPSFHELLARFEAFDRRRRERAASAAAVAAEAAAAGVAARVSTTAAAMTTTTTTATATATTLQSVSEAQEKAQEDDAETADGGDSDCFGAATDLRPASTVTDVRDVRDDGDDDDEDDGTMVATQHGVEAAMLRSLRILALSLIGVLLGHAIFRLAMAFWAELSRMRSHKD